MPALVRTIGDTFLPPKQDADLKAIKHPAKRARVAVDTLELLPDEDVWNNTYDVVRFTERPGDRPVEVCCYPIYSAPKVLKDPLFISQQPDTRLDCGILRPQESDGDHYLSLYLPREDADAEEFKSRRQVDEDAESEEKPVSPKDDGLRGGES